MKILKNIYDQIFFDRLISSISKFYPSFNQKKFLNLIYNQNWDQKELKERMRHISLSLQKSLSENSYIENINILKKVAQDIELPKENISGLSLIIFADYVEIFGMNDFQTSISALEYFTEFGSSEFAIRKFILKYEEQTLEIIKKWANHNNYHIRRLASEGCRPRLPWAIALPKYKKDPKNIIPILEILKNDSEEYVRRSVANNLNDISKDNPQTTLNLSKKWLNQNNEKLIKHGLRTLLKSGNQEALELFGFTNNNLLIDNFRLNKEKVNIGDQLELSFSLHSQENCKVRLEYAVYFLRKNGQYSKKVFQIIQKKNSKTKESFTKKHSFKKITTRKYYPGLHKISLITNGVESKFLYFTLKEIS